MLPKFLMFVQERVTRWLLFAFYSSAALICRTITATLPSTSKLYSEKGEEVCVWRSGKQTLNNKILTAHNSTAGFIILNTVRNQFALNMSRNKMCLRTDEQYCWPNMLCSVHKVCKGKKCLFFLMSFNWLCLGVSFNNIRYTPVSERIVDGGLETAQ